MEAGVGGGGSIGDGTSSGGSVSTVSKEEVVVEQRKTNYNSNNNNNMSMSNFEVSSSYPHQQEEEEEDDGALELGLCLGVGGGLKSGVAVCKQQVPRILTAKDLPASISLTMANSSARPINANPSNSSPSSASSSSPPPTTVGSRVNHNENTKATIGTKRTAESVNSPTGVSQVVGWPPLRPYRLQSMANQAKSFATGEFISKIDQCKETDSPYGGNCDIKEDVNGAETGHHSNSLFVKVNMHGVGIGRKIDLSAYTSYKSLGRKLEEMFDIPTRTVGNLGGDEHGTVCNAEEPSELVDGSSEFVLTYEDKDGDWMLVGDVPWRMFLSTVKRLRIMKTSEARGLAPRCEERNTRQRTMPV